MPAVTFAGVTDITIPEGNVVKITRKSDGVVLWERVKCKPLYLCTPAEIQKIIQAGNAAECWSVGDLTAPIALNGTVGGLTFNGETYHARILGIDHNKDVESDGEYNVHFGFANVRASGNGIVDLAFADSQYGATGSGAGFMMNLSMTHSGGWEDSYMRNTICAQFLAAMPAEWRAIITECVKWTDNVGDNTDDASHLTPTVDKIFLLSEFELHGKRTQSNISTEASKQKRYAYYTQINSARRFRHDADTTYCKWWQRSTAGTVGFCEATITGVGGGSGATNSSGFAPAFMVA